jgi:hypothetical protein
MAQLEDIVLTPEQREIAARESRWLRRWRDEVVSRADAIEAGACVCSFPVKRGSEGSLERCGARSCSRLVGIRVDEHGDPKARIEPCNPEMETDMNIDAVTLSERLERMLKMRGDLLTDDDLAETEHFLDRAPAFAAGTERAAAHAMIREGAADEADVERAKRLVQAARARIASLRATRTDSKYRRPLTVEEALAKREAVTYAVGREVHDFEPDAVAAAAKVREAFRSPAPTDKTRIDATTDPALARERMLARNANAWRNGGGEGGAA